MSNKHHVFEQLGRNANGGPLRPPFDEPTTATDVAIAIHAVAGRGRACRPPRSGMSGVAHQCKPHR